MAIDLNRYAAIKDKYCIAYLGSCEEYLVQLSLIRPIIEAKYKGIEIYICCRDKFTVLDGQDRILHHSDLKKAQNQFAYIREITHQSDGSHPIEKLWREASLSSSLIKQSNCNTTLCAIYPNSAYPTKSLNADQIKKLHKMATNKGFAVVVDKPDLDGVGWVIGVENKELFTAASKGIKTTLVTTGVGTNLYKSMFPSGEILLPTHI